MFFCSKKLVLNLFGILSFLLPLYLKEPLQSSFVYMTKSCPPFQCFINLKTGRVLFNKKPTYNLQKGVKSNDLLTNKDVIVLCFILLTE